MNRAIRGFDRLCLRRNDARSARARAASPGDRHADDYIPVHLRPCYRRRYGELSLPGAQASYERCLSLPFFPDMTEEDVTRIVMTLRRAVERTA